MRVYKISGSLIVGLCLAISLLAPADVLAGGKNGRNVKDNIGTFTVKCYVHKNAPGNHIVGIVVGNHPSDSIKAERDANLFVSKFGTNLAKRHCHTMTRYTPRGAYDTQMNPL